jgi:O-antigen biosynthesis protein
MEFVRTLLLRRPELRKEVKIIYDAEAILSLREIELQKLEGNPLSLNDQERLVKKEMVIVDLSQCVISVSDSEKKKFIEYGFKNVHTLSHAVDISPTPNLFHNRRDILFIGAIHEISSPNADSMIWFINEIFPIIREGLNDVKLIIAGQNTTCLLQKVKIEDDSIEIKGKVEDLTSLYKK